MVAFYLMTSRNENSYLASLSEPKAPFKSDCHILRKPSRRSTFGNQSIVD